MRFVEPLERLGIEQLTCADVATSLLAADQPLALCLLASVNRSELNAAAEALVHYLAAQSDEALVDALMDVAEREIDVTLSLATLFRGNSMASKMLTAFVSLAAGGDYLRDTLGPTVRKLIDSDAGASLVLGADMAPDELHAGVTRAKVALASLVADIEASLDALPACVRLISRRLHAAVEAKFGDEAALVTQAGFFFLRFLCPAIATPQRFGIVAQADVSADVQRSLLLLSKLSQNLANGTKLKEPHLAELNTVALEALAPRVIAVLKALPAGGDAAERQLSARTRTVADAAADGALDEAAAVMLRRALASLAGERYRDAMSRRQSEPSGALATALRVDSDAFVRQASSAFHAAGIVDGSQRDATLSMLVHLVVANEALIDLIVGDALLRKQDRTARAEFARALFDVAARHRPGDAWPLVKIIVEGEALRLASLSHKDSFAPLIVGAALRHIDIGERAARRLASIVGDAKALGRTVEVAESRLLPEEKPRVSENVERLQAFAGRTIDAFVEALRVAPSAIADLAHFAFVTLPAEYHQDVKRSDPTRFLFDVLLQPLLKRTASFPWLGEESEALSSPVRRALATVAELLGRVVDNRFYTDADPAHFRSANAYIGGAHKRLRDAVELFVNESAAIASASAEPLRSAEPFDRATHIGNVNAMLQSVRSVVASSKRLEEPIAPPQFIIQLSKPTLYTEILDILLQ
jgi:GTPase-activator protein for Ras-like GTPase